MSIDEKDFNKIAEAIASEEAGGKDGADGADSVMTEGTGNGLNANDRLRHILGETETTADGTHAQTRTDVDAVTPGNEQSGRTDVADNALISSAGAGSHGAVRPDAGSADAGATGEGAGYTSGTAETDAPDPSVVNWARQLWRSPGSAYGSSRVTLHETAVSKNGVAGKTIRTLLITLLCVAIGIITALQFKAIGSKASPAPDSEDQIKELLSMINNMHSELGSLEAERNELQNRLDLVEQSSQDEQIASLRDELNRVRTFAGLTSVKGRGIHVQLNFTERTNINSIQNRLLLLINELRASGAQAISINGIRILGMTEIRVVSDQYISVGARQLIAPYDIYAIGDASNLYSGITMGGSGIVFQIRDLAGTTCTWDIQENIIINAASDEDIKTDLLTAAP